MQTCPNVDKTVRLLIVDSSPIVRTGIHAMLTAHQSRYSFQISEADDLSAGIEKATKFQFQLILLEEDLLSVDNTFVKTITSICPTVRLIIMGVFPNAHFISSLVEQGVQGYIPKTITIKELTAAIVCILNNEPFICSRVASLLLNLKREPLPSLPKISNRESEILRLILKEKTTQEIARQLVVAPSTIETHRKNLMLKLHVKNTAGLVRAAYEYNLVGSVG